MRDAVVALAAVVLAGSALHAQVRTEAQLLGVVTTASDPFVGGGVGLGVRSAGRLRVLLNAAVGAVDGTAAGRGEAIVTFSLNPARRRGVVPYVGGGMAAIVLANELREYLVASLGVESRPGSRTGWFAEIGVGGGLRAVIGLRLRWRRAPRATR